MSRTISPYCVYSWQRPCAIDYLSLRALKLELDKIDDFNDQLVFIKKSYNIKDDVGISEIYLNNGLYLRFALSDYEYYVAEFNVGENKNWNDCILESNFDFNDSSAVVCVCSK